MIYGNEFQNTICYCLTMQSAQQKIAANLFQNIICYCLTIYGISCEYGSRISKHHMLLFNLMVETE